jgi:hypothetical protein
MRALTVRQPQAAALLSGRGPTRHPGWLTDHRGPLLIHAARRGRGDPTDDGLAYGALLGVVELLDCVACRHTGGDPGEVGYAWVLTSPRAFRRPVPHPGGRPGLFDVADQVVADALAPPAPRQRKRRKKTA